MLKIYSNGLTLGVPPSNPVLPENRGGKSTGWSDASTRSNTTFLFTLSMPLRSLAMGTLFTFTLRDLPPHLKIGTTSGISL